MFVGYLHALLNELYDLELSYDIYDFLTTDETIAAALTAGCRTASEQLLIAEGEDEAAVSLYLEQALVDRLDSNDPIEDLNERNLGDFWLAFEGVSHFTYYAYRAELEKPVTLLEMELQAEIDKFVATAMLFARQLGSLPRGLHSWLFSATHFDPRLNAAELERYARANHYASRYCAALWPRLARGGLTADRRLKPELRRFYRLSQPEKLGHIESVS